MSTAPESSANKPASAERTLAATKGNKVLMAHAQRLTDQVKAMSEKIQQLEQALEEAHKRFDPTHQHPLLGKSPSHSPGNAPDMQPMFDNDSQIGDATDAIGSLSIGHRDQTKYHREIAGSEVSIVYSSVILANPVIPDDSPRPASTDPKNLGLTPEIAELCNAFPFGLQENPYARYAFSSYIPTRDRALHLANLYYENFAWMYDPIVKSDFMNSIIDPLYGQFGFMNLHSHTLSVFFILLASGALYDGGPSAMLEAERYYALARAALSVDSMLNETSCSTVQALLMIIGLPTTFNTTQSIVNGRPPSLSINHTDCKFPDDTSIIMTHSGHAEMGCTTASFALFARQYLKCILLTGHNWKFRFSASCLSISVSHLFNTRPPNYQALLELDRKIRKFVVPSHLQSPTEASEVGRIWSMESSRAMQQYCSLCIQQSSERSQTHFCTVHSLHQDLLYIHRSYFAQAISEAPDDPLQHKYSASVIAVYRSACRLVFSLKGLYRVHPIPTSHQRFFWSGIFSCCVILGALVAESPRCPLSKNAIKEFDEAVMLYERGSQSCRPPSTLPFLQKLRERAMSAFSAAQTGGAPLPPQGSHSPSVPDELDVLKGHRTFITRPSPSSSPGSSGSSYTYTAFRPGNEDFSDQLRPPSQPALVNYYNSQFDSESTLSNTYYTSGSSPHDTFGGNFPLYDPSVQSTAPSLHQPPVHIIHPAPAVPTTSPSLSALPQHPPSLQPQQFHQQAQIAGAGAGATAQSQNREEVWQQFTSQRFGAGWST
ncbi:hypothetical protein ID866_6438 [Astraeus odoratus]|nr:hypothetical protein ID866_6438 [Astraeus odoratus]